jgi:hypothetical protein
MEGDEILGYCGLYCGGCLEYQNTSNGAATTREDGQLLYCKGCNSGTLTPWCSDCAIKSCAREKGLRYCLPCEEFPCDKMTQFINDPKYPYHKDVVQNMKRLEQVGLDEWRKEQEARYTCGACGNKFNWFESRCKQCESPIGIK